MSISVFVVDLAVFISSRAEAEVFLGLQDSGSVNDVSVEPVVVPAAAVVFPPVSPHESASTFVVGPHSVVVFGAVSSAVTIVGVVVLWGVISEAAFNESISVIVSVVAARASSLQKSHHS